MVGSQCIEGTSSICSVKSCFTTLVNERALHNIYNACLPIVEQIHANQYEALTCCV